MNRVNILLLGVALLFGVTVGVSNYLRRRKEKRGELSGLRPQLYRPANLPYGLFIGYVLMATLLSPLLFGSRREELSVSPWAAEEVAAAVRAGVTDGSRPRAFATREEVAAMVRRGQQQDRDSGGRSAGTGA